jgi:hypothetical protein
LLDTNPQRTVLMKREARIPTRRRHLVLAAPAAPGPRTPAISAPPLARGELVSLLQRLRDEIDACLNDLGNRREPSGNRESSRRI